MFVDTHCHLYQEYYDDLEQVRNKGIQKENDFKESLKVDLNIQGQGENINNNNLSKNKEIDER